MATTNGRLIFPNVPVRDLQKSIAFFKALGFEFNSQFTDEKGACMIVSDKAMVMLLTEPFFKGFTKNAIADTATHTECFLAISCDSRDAVNAMVEAAVANGGRHAMPAQDHGFMYGWSFYDLDGHHWEPLWMDPSVPQ